MIEPVPKPQTRPNAQHRPSAATTTIHGSKADLEAETEAAYAAADAELGFQRPGQWSREPPVQSQRENDVDLSALQARVAELEAQQVRLQRLEQEAREAASAKQGEIAIVRANQEKWTKEYERRIAVMQKLHTDETAKHKAEMEAGKKEREKMETSNRFLQHEAQESERAKRLNGPGRARTAQAVKEKETPRKAKRPNRGDGFDDDEVLVISPSKSKERPKDQTPKAGAKRKRTAEDSPIGVLSFNQPAQPVRHESNEQPERLTGVTLPTAHADDKFEFMQRFLIHRPYEGHERSVEALAKLSFPSKPEESLSSIVMNELTSTTIARDSDSLPVKLCRVSLKLWDQCAHERTFTSLYLIMDMLRFALYSERSGVVSQLIEEAVPLCIGTITRVAMPVATASVNATYAASDECREKIKVAEGIDVDEIMDFLLRLCQASTLTDGRLEVFWQFMEYTFDLLMLHKGQPLGQIRTFLQILATSALPSSFGAIASDANVQVKQGTDIIDRLTRLLFELPGLPNDEPPYSEEEIAALRLEILNVFRAMCLTDYGGLLLAQHRAAIGRLVRFLNIQVNKLYSLPPTSRSPLSDDDEVQSAHDLVIATVNQTTRLIYHLLRTFDDNIDISQKMAVIHGGYHKFLISMTRIAFSEQLVFEHGIEDEVAEAAHTILNNMLSPEEGEAIVKAVATPRGTKGTSAIEMDETTVVDDHDATMSEPG